MSEQIPTSKEVFERIDEVLDATAETRAAQMTEQDRTWLTAYEFANVGEKALVISAAHAVYALMEQWDIKPAKDDAERALVAAIARYVIVSKL